jgi:vacuolar-type H+-ATPase subunit E/Vma4
MTREETQLVQALEPARAALLAAAREQAAGLVARAEEEGRRHLAEARARVEALLAEARAQGTADAATGAAEDLAQARRRGRRAVLEAQATVYAELRDAVWEGVRTLLADPSRRTALEAALRLRLAAIAADGDAVITGRGDGGVVASAGGCTLDVSVQALVDAVTADVDLEQLWTTT